MPAVSLTNSTPGRFDVRRARVAFFAWLIGAVIFSTLLRAREADAPATAKSDASVASAASSPESGTITRVADYWSLTPAERQTVHNADLEITVYYYDPIWRLLWGDDHGQPFYLAAVRKAMPMRAGQRVRITGPALTATGLDGEKAKVSVLEDSAPLVPIEAKGRISDWKTLNTQLIHTDAYVDRQTELNENHVTLSLIVDGTKVLGRIWLDEHAEVPQFEGTKISVSGVFIQSMDPSGQLSQKELWIGSIGQISIMGNLQTDPGFKLPITPIDQLHNASLDTLVHVAGIVKEQVLGTYLIVEDDTGVARIEAAQTDVANVGSRIEAIGFPDVRSLHVQIWRGLFRPEIATAPGARVTSSTLARIRLIDRVKALSVDEAASGREVRLRGLLTWLDPKLGSCFIQDASGGIRVQLPKELPDLGLVPGALLEINGVTVATPAGTQIKAMHVERQREAPYPTPRLLTLDQALNGTGDSEWSEITGYLRSATQEDNFTKLQLTTASGEFTAYLPANTDVRRFENAVVAVRGVSDAVFNDRRQAVGIRLWSTQADDVHVVEAFPKNFEQLPKHTVASIGQFGFFPANSRWARTGGIVTLYLPGRYMYIQDGVDSLRVLVREHEPITTGDLVDVVGLPGREGRRIVLREAVAHKIGKVTEPTAFTLSFPHQPNPAYDGRLVEFRGTVIESGVHGDHPRLTLDTDGVVVEAVGRTIPSSLFFAPTWRPGSVVSVRGVYQLESDDYQRPYSFHVDLRRTDDVTVLRAPPWWTVRRAVAAMGALAVFALIGVAAVFSLRSQVRRQTNQIRLQLEKEARLEAEVERSSRLEALGVLAGGIAHDFNNLLTVVVGNVTLAQTEVPPSSEVATLLKEAINGAMRARDLTQQLLTFARGGDPVRAAISLPEVIREAAEFALHGSPVALDFKFDHGVWPANADKGQLGQVVHNLALNASQAMPQGGRIQFALENEDRRYTDALLKAGRYIKLTVSDNGPGIAPENIGRIFDPYFSTKPTNSGLGLATVRSIVRKHNGHIEADSRLGHGTTFRIWIPAATSAPVSATSPTPAPVAQDSSKRILFMDDDNSIRRIAGMLLQRLGFDHVVVSDGRAAVDAYAKALRTGRPFDAVILDLTVPGGMGGREAMEKLLEIDPTVRAIVSSGYSSDPVLSDFQAHGFKAMVPKPYNVVDLAKCIHEVVGT
ncbi:MAG TPA: ATP-binding protein [Opitutaceae bacterium]|nr:ATP-binding protein [Opitutaceae bacterium]